MSDDRDEKGRFVSGNIGGPGRGRGSRNKLGEAFLDALHNDFNTHGVAAIEEMRANDPGGYVRVIASILPKEVKVTTQDFTDEQLEQRIRQLASALDIEVRTSRVADGETTPLRPH